MNKRQKKKLYKRKMGKNPPREMKFFEKDYHKAINNPRSKKKTEKYILENCQQPLLKGWDKIKATIDQAAEAIRKWFYAVGIMTSEITLNSYDKNTENIVNLTKVLTKQRKVRRG